MVKQENDKTNSPFIGGSNGEISSNNRIKKNEDQTNRMNNSGGDKASQVEITSLKQGRH